MLSQSALPPHTMSNPLKPKDRIQMATTNSILSIRKIAESWMMAWRHKKSSLPPPANANRDHAGCCENRFQQPQPDNLAVSVTLHEDPDIESDNDSGNGGENKDGGQGNKSVNAKNKHTADDDTSSIASSTACEGPFTPNNSCASSSRFSNASWDRISNSASSHSIVTTASATSVAAPQVLTTITDYHQQQNTYTTIHAPTLAHPSASEVSLSEQTIVDDVVYTHDYGSRSIWEHAKLVEAKA